MAQYDVDSIQVLKGLEAVRRRPGMYVGGTGKVALHHLLWEPVDNAVDEAMANRCGAISITLWPDGSAEVSDDGEGIPPYWKTEENKATLEIALTTLHAGAKFDDGAYRTSGGLHGVGIKATNALSQWLVAESRRDGLCFIQAFRQGVPVDGVWVMPPESNVVVELASVLDSSDGSGLQKVRESALCTLGSAHTAYGKLPAQARKASRRRGFASGSTIRFKPDPEIMAARRFDRPMIADRLQQTSFLVSAAFAFEDLRRKRPFRQVYDGKHKGHSGLAGLVAYLNHDAGRTPIAANRAPIAVSGSFENDDGTVEVEIAIQYTDDPDGDIVSFVNTIPTKHGGTHVSGVRTAISRALTSIGKKRRKLRDKERIAGVDTLFGLTLAISVRMPEMAFTSQTKDELTSPISGGVSSAIYAPLVDLLSKKSKLADAIVALCTAAAAERRAATRAKKLTARRSLMMDLGPDLSKLADINTNGLQGTALYIVEGDSAGGSARQARDRTIHAILPLRGKVINTARVKPAKMLTNAEIRSIIAAIGGGFGREFDISAMRYGRVVIFVDADVDGGHIAALLLTFFFKHMRPLIQAGKLWVARAPLHRIQVGKESIYTLTEAEKDALLRKYRRKSELRITRFKGLGEMSPAEMRATTLQPGQEFDEKGKPYRSILNKYHVQITLDDTHRAAALVSRLMGNAVAPRREWIEETWLELDTEGNGP